MEGDLRPLELDEADLEWVDDWSERWIDSSSSTFLKSFVTKGSVSIS